LVSHFVSRSRFASHFVLHFVSHLISHFVSHFHTLFYTLFHTLFRTVFHTFMHVGIAECKNKWVDHGVPKTPRKCTYTYAWGSQSAKEIWKSVITECQSIGDHRVPKKLF
jgi:hypothetical protein